MAEYEFSKEEDKKIRDDFPLLNNRDIVYMDNAATTQKPVEVIDSWKRYYENYNANPFRGVYGLSVDATEVYEDARKAVAGFIGADSYCEIVFTRNASESINLLSTSLCEYILQPGDEIIVSIAEHHSNFLPWQQAAKRYGAKVVFFECEEDGEFKKEKLEELITGRTRILAITHLSNVLGRINDVKTFAEICHKNHVLISVDGAQSVPHIPVNVKELDVDFLQFSGHKMLAPMGIGVLYGKEELLNAMPPYMYGGEMIETVTRDGATYAELPHKFEAGTVNVGGAAALAAAEYVKAALHTCFLLNGAFMPYYKWQFRALADLPSFGELAEPLAFLISSENAGNTAEEKYTLIEDLAGVFIAELMDQGITKASCGDLEKHAYSVNDHIQDGEIRNLHILAGI